jgi:HSP20 family protein
VLQVIRWSPNTELANLHSAMDRLFQDFFGPSTTDGGQRSATPSYLLPIDVKEVENGYRIHAPVPGFKPEEVEVSFSDGVLQIQARHSEETKQEEGGYLRREVAYGNYQRSIQLPGDVKEDEISADFEDGVLTVNVPKMPRPEPKKIQVSAGSQKQVTGKTS